MKLFFSTRSNARKSNAGKLCDNGVQSPKGRRWSRTINATARKTSNTSVVSGVPVSFKQHKHY